MEREELTPEDRAACDEFIATYPYLDPDGLVYEGSNLIVGDQLEVDNAWRGEVLGGETGLVWFFVPAWGLTLPIDLINYVTDRIGPDGQTMPIFDPPVEINPLCEPSLAAAMAHKAPRRTFAEVLRDSLRRLSPDDEHTALEALHNVLDCDKPWPPPQRPRWRPHHPHHHGGRK